MNWTYINRYRETVEKGRREGEGRREKGGREKEGRGRREREGEGREKRERREGEGE